MRSIVLTLTDVRCCIIDGRVSGMGGVGGDEAVLGSSSMRWLP